MRSPYSGGNPVERFFNRIGQKLTSWARKSCSLSDNKKPRATPGL